MTGKEEVLPEKGLFEKAATVKKLKYSPLGSDLKMQIDIARKQYQGLDKVHEFDGIRSKDNKSDLTYNTNHSFYKYCDTEKFENLTLE